jgi:hypothetical protein
MRFPSYKLDTDVIQESRAEQRCALSRSGPS